MALALILCLPGKGQDKHAAWDSLQQSIIYLHGTDTVFSLPLDKTFYAQLNHEKKTKRKTVRYRLARYAQPTDVEPVPVVITNNNALLCLRGNLQGDTTAVFSLMLSLQDEIPVLEVTVPQLSVNEFSFQLNYRRTDQCPTPISLPKEAPPVSQRRKRHGCRIHVYGNSYRIAFRGV